MNWKAIPGYESRYEVSDEGRVRSLGIIVGARGGKTAFRPGRMLQPAVKDRGYLQVTLVAEDGGRKSWLVHQLVCLAFIGPCPDGHETRHIDGSKDNNCLGNLQYGTAADNAADRAAHGTFKSGWALYNRRASARYAK